MGSMRDDFDAAIESVGADLDETPQEILFSGEEENTDIGLGEEESNIDEKDPVETAEKVEQTEEQKPEKITKRREKQGDEVAAKGAKESKDSVKAPVDWSPKEREDWSKIPRPLQDKIINREKEMAQAMSGTADARKTHDYIDHLAKSYAPVLAAEGVSSPLQAIDGLFKTVASLRLGTPQDKAAKMAQMIQHYGIDIGTLDSVLAGQAPKANPNQEIEQMLDKRMAPVNQLMNHLGQIQQNQATQSQQKATDGVKQFAEGHEFLDDVRMDMADLIDMAAKQGRELTLEQAYDRACAVNPEIAEIIAQRKKQESLLGNNNSIAQKRAAASSLRGRQIGNGAQGVMSLRDTIADAWDSAG